MYGLTGKRTVRLTCRKAFSMSKTKAILFKRNRSQIPVRSCNMTGPLCKQSFRLLFSSLVLAEASYTILTLVVVFVGFITG